MMLGIMMFFDKGLLAMGNVRSVSWPLGQRALPHDLGAHKPHGAVLRWRAGAPLSPVSDARRASRSASSS